MDAEVDDIQDDAVNGKVVNASGKALLI